MGHEHDPSQDIQLLDLLDAASIPQTIEDYAQSDQVLHVPVSPGQRPRYYFDAANHFPDLPPQSPIENITLNARRGSWLGRRKFIREVMGEIMAATYDGAISPENVFSGTVWPRPEPSVIHPVELTVEDALTGRAQKVIESRSLRFFVSLCAIAGLMGGVAYPVQAMKQPPATVEGAPNTKAIFDEDDTPDSDQ